MSIHCARELRALADALEGVDIPVSLPVAAYDLSDFLRKSADELDEANIEIVRLLGMMSRPTKGGS